MDNGDGLQLFSLLITVPALSVTFWLFRKHAMKTIFLIAIAFMYSPIAAGIGTYAARNLFAAYAAALESVFILAVAAATLPPLLFILKRLCNNPFMERAVIFWRFIWMLPMLFFLITIVTSSYLNDKEKSGLYFIKSQQ